MSEDEDWQTNPEFANISVRNFGGATGDLTLKPLTLLYGPPESGVSSMASLLNAVVVHGASYSVHDDVCEVPLYETDFLSSYVHVDREEAYRVFEKRRQKVKSVDSNYLTDFAKKHLHLFALGLGAGLLNPDSPLQQDAAGFGVTLVANRARGRLEYADDGLEEFPDQPRLRINFVRHGTARKRDKVYDGGPGPYLIRRPYHYVGPRPRESNRGIHIDSYLGGDAEILRNVLNAALGYYSERKSQPQNSVLVSDGGLTAYEPPGPVRSGDVMYGARVFAIDRIRGPAHASAKDLQTALAGARRGTMIVVENPEKHVDDMESFARMLLGKANEGLFMLVATGDQTLAETVAEMRQEPGGLDAEYAAVYGFEPENGGHAIIEY